MNAVRHRPLRHLLITASTLLLSFGLTACGGGGGGTSPLASLNTSGTSGQTSGNNPTPVGTTYMAQDYAPFKVGDRRVYSMVTGDPVFRFMAYTYTVDETRSVAGQAGFIISAVEPGNDTATWHDFVTLDGGGLVYSAAPDLTGPRPKTTLELPAQFRIGDAPETGLTISGIEDITTRAGTFKNCIKTTRVDTQGSAESNWFAPGIGLVKYTTTTASYELQAYELAGVRSETTAPVASPMNLPSESNGNRFGEVIIEFNEPMQTATLNASSIVVTTPTGQVVTGTLTKSATWVSFVPANGALTSSGTYSISVTNSAKDWAGNGATPVKWTFPVNVSTPAI